MSIATARAYSASENGSAANSSLVLAEMRAREVIPCLPSQSLVDKVIHPDEARESPPAFPSHGVRLLDESFM